MICGNKVKSWVQPTLRLLASLIVLQGTSIVAYGQSSAEYIEACNAGKIDAYADQEVLLENLPMIAFMNRSCVSSVMSNHSELAPRIAMLVGDSDYLLSTMSPLDFESFVEYSFSFGSRSSFNFSKETLNYYVEKVSSPEIDISRYVNILGFLGSTSLDAHERIKDYLPIGKIMQFTKISGEELRMFSDYCQRAQCKPVREQIDFCGFSNPIAMKFEAISSPATFWGRLRACGPIGASEVAKLRVIGVLDGRCSFALQQSTLQSTDSLPVLTCEDQLRRAAEISAFDDLDGIFFFSMMSEDGSTRAFRNAEYSETARKFLRIWPELKSLTGDKQ